MPFGRFKELDKIENLLVLCERCHADYDAGMINIIPQPSVETLNLWEHYNKKYKIKHVDVDNPIHNTYLFVMPPGYSKILPEGHNLNPVFFMLQNSFRRKKFESYVGQHYYAGAEMYPGPMGYQEADPLSPSEIHSYWEGDLLRRHNPLGRTKEEVRAALAQAGGNRAETAQNVLRCTACKEKQQLKRKIRAKRRSMALKARNRKRKQLPLQRCRGRTQSGKRCSRRVHGDRCQNH